MERTAMGGFSMEQQFSSSLRLYQRVYQVMGLDKRTALVTVGVILLCFVAIPIHIEQSDNGESEQLFQVYIQKFNKSYDPNSIHYSTRYNNFKESLKQIEKLNGGRTNVSAIYGLTKFSDMSSDEFLHHHLQPNLHERLKMSHHHHKAVHKYHNKEKRAVDEALPMHVDWREKNVITAIRNQKTCGACWAFSTIETVESMHALKLGVLQSLSVQEIIDCARNGNLGCSGGDTCSLLEWLYKNNITIETDKEYPLMWKTGTCKLKGPGSGIRIASNYTCDYLVDQEDKLLASLAYHGPVIVAINALSWQNYLGGVIQFHCDGGPVFINHAVQIVGYNRNAPVPHYIIRNSWGPEFGDKGYIYVAIGSNMCGLAVEVSSLDVL